MFINKYLFLETLFYLISKITHNMQKKNRNQMAIFCLKNRLNLIKNNYI